MGRHFLYFFPRAFGYFRPNESELEIHTPSLLPKVTNILATVTGILSLVRDLHRRPQGQGRVRAFHKVPTHRLGARWPPEVVSSLVNTMLEGWNLSRTVLSHQSLPMAQKHPNEGKQSGSLSDTENVQKPNLQPPCCCPQRGAAQTVHTSLGGKQGWVRIKLCISVCEPRRTSAAAPLGRLKPNLLL